MSEGPQVKLRADWLARHLNGQRVDRVQTSRPSLAAAAAAWSGCALERCYCRGKHLFIRFRDGVTLHNHLLMHGKWRAGSGPFLFLPEGMWLALERGGRAFCNWNGQVLEALDEAGVRAIEQRLGPDLLADPYPVDAVVAALAGSARPVAEAILDQAVVCGVGNIAKSESLFRAGIDPRTPADQLAPGARDRLVAAMRAVLCESYEQGGRWTRRVYRRRGERCPRCAGRIAVIRQPPSRRSTYFCPVCQRSPAGGGVDRARRIG
jgi:endonuclease VIII